LCSAAAPQPNRLAASGEREADVRETVVRNPEQYYTGGMKNPPAATPVAATAERAQDDKSRIQSIGKMMDILECFSAVNRHRTLGQVAAACAMPRPSAHRMLTALREIGFIEQDARNGSYSLGIRLFELGSTALANMDLLR